MSKSWPAIGTGRATIKVSRASCSLAAILAFLLLLVWPTPSQAGAQEPTRCDWSEQDYSDFYAPPDLGEFDPERLGEVLRVEHMASYSPDEVAAWAGNSASPYGAEQYRILYYSQTADNQPEAISGEILVPTNVAPSERLPVVAFAHSSTSLADTCAPSQQVPGPYINLYMVFIGQGYVVSATDYRGLGTPGIQPYLVGREEGRDVLDSARAAQGFCDDAQGIVALADNRVLLYGSSRGGHSALFAHELWPEYAPDLEVLGTVAAAPGSELLYLIPNAVADAENGGFDAAVIAMYTYYKYYDHPEPIQSWMQEPYATSLPSLFENACAISVAARVTALGPDRLLQEDFLSKIRAGDWDQLQPWTDYALTNTPGSFTSLAPILIIQGTEDSIVLPEASRRLARSLCRHDTTIQYSLYPGEGHNVKLAGMEETLTWMADRVAGSIAPNNCSELMFRSFLPLAGG